MPTYVRKALEKLNHTTPSLPQHVPYKGVPITYGKQPHNTQEPDNTPFLSKEDTRHIQRNVGTFLYYARAVDTTIHPAINDMSITQAKSTQQTKIAADMFIDYLSTHQNTTLTFYKSDMQAYVDSDAAYLLSPQAKSRAAGYFYLSIQNTTHPIPTKPPLNAPIHVECTCSKHIVSSAAVTETGALFHNCKVAIGLKNMLESLGHKQTIQVKIDDATTSALCNATLEQKKKQKN